MPLGQYPADQTTSAVYFLATAALDRVRDGESPS